MKLKKFAALVLMFTAASGLAMKPASMVTAVASEVVSEGPALEADNTLSYTDTDTTAANTDTTANTDMAAGENTDTTNNTSNNTDNTGSKAKEKTSKNRKKSKAKPKAKTRTKTKQKSRSSYSKADLRLMSSIINCEAGIEPYQGKIAVGIVVMNRIKSKNFPNTLKGVIYQRGQFSPVRNGSLRRRLSEYDSGRIKSKQWKTCIRAAKKVLTGQRTILYRGKEKKMDNFYFFSVGLSNARLRLGGHKFK